jgi:hypothetical protein
MSTDKLAEAGSLFIHAKDQDEEIRASECLASLIALLPTDPHVGNEVSTALDSGLALSPAHAADCLHEYIRTARFVKGSWLALQTLMQQFKGEKIHVLYAGCGPYATILLPLLPLLDLTRVRITFLDIHQHSINRLSALLKHFRLDDDHFAFTCADAVHYTWPHEALHLVITETMFKALMDEPHASIASNLAPQITKNGLLIPAEIRIDMALTTYVQEPFIDPAYHQLPQKRNEGGNLPRILYPLFRLDPDSLFRGSTDPAYSSEWFKIPEDISVAPDICLLTTVRIFDDIQLTTGESTITNPYCLYSLYNLGAQSHFRLNYFLHSPRWQIESSARV